jgi:hypothetical protein
MRFVKYLINKFLQQTPGHCTSKSISTFYSNNSAPKLSDFLIFRKVNVIIIFVILGIDVDSGYMLKWSKWLAGATTYYRIFIFLHTYL